MHRRRRESLEPDQGNSCAETGRQGKGRSEERRAASQGRSQGTRRVRLKLQKNFLEVETGRRPMTTAFARSLSKGITIATILKQTPSHHPEAESDEADACTDAGAETDSEAAAEAGEPVADAGTGEATAEREDGDEADSERAESLVAADALAQ